MKGTIFAVALNHRSQLDAWQEAFQQSPYKAPPKTAVWFIKPRNTVIGCGEPIPFPQGEKVLSGATVALIVGKTATKVREEDAAEYIAGYALANDVSLPEESFYRPAIKAKCRDGFCPIGETVALSNVDNLTIYTEINGRPADHWNTADLQRNAAQLLSALSEFATLNPGDAILLGTPQARVEIQPGDRVRVLAEGFPPLENPVVDEREVTTRKSFPTQPHPHGTLFALGLNYADHASELKKVNHWINGKNVAGNDYFQTTNPATGEVLADVASGGEAEINQAVAAAKEAFPKWANLPMKERARLMRRLGDLIDQNVPEIAAMETADTGLPIHQTKNVLIPRASHNFEFFAEVCQQMNGKTYPVDDKMLNYTLVQPVGVCALVSPWNVPFMTATWKVAPCLALGNTAVLKMSELSPLTADRLGELALEAGIPAGVLNVVQGYGATAGDALVRHHDVRAVSFTGGTATGRNIMKNAGLKKYSMELGGKSPVLIFEDADIERALDAALFTIFSINGERCTAGSRIFIQQSIYPEFVKRFAERANRLRVGDPNDPNTQVGALISQQHWEKVSGYIRLGIEEGATLLAGGPDKPSDLPAHLKGGNFLRPTVLADVDNRMRVAQEEIFGPVACLLPFKDEAEGLRLANDVEYGLASYIWTQDVSKVLRLARGIEAGMVFVNTQNVRDLRQPFGGVKASGTGREGGEYSFEVFAEMKNVCISMGDHPIPKWGV